MNSDDAPSDADPPHVELEKLVLAQPKGVGVAIAHRAAMRVLPLATDLHDEATAPKVALASMRACLTSGVVVLRRSKELSHAINFADDVAYNASKLLRGDVYQQAIDATTAACEAVSYSRGLGSAMDQSRDQEAVHHSQSSYWADIIQIATRAAGLSKDFLLDGPNDELAVVSGAKDPAEKLMHSRNDTLEPFAPIIARAQDPRNALRGSGPWNFWAKWYARAMVGDPLPWGLQEQVALIPNDIWDAGPEAVAERIQTIEYDYHGIKLDEEAAKAEIARLTSAPGFYADILEGASVGVNYHIKLFQEKTGLNRLPDGFSGFNTIASSFASTAIELRKNEDRGADIAELKAKLRELHAVIAELRRELREARSELLNSAHSVSEVSRLNKIGKAAVVTVAGLASLGSIASGVEAVFQLNDRRLEYYASLREEVQELAQAMEHLEIGDISGPKPKK